MHAHLLMSFTSSKKSQENVCVYIHMAVYNGEDFIQKAIDSCIQQHHHNWHLVVIDDGSTDSTLELVRRNSDRRISTIPLPSNQGLWKARNRGRKDALSKTKWTFFTTLDADDFADRNWLRKNISLATIYEPFGIRPINNRINQTGKSLFTYPACDQTFWSRRAIEIIGLMKESPGANDSEYMAKAEKFCRANNEFIMLAKHPNQSMLVHEKNHSGIQSN